MTNHVFHPRSKRCLGCDAPPAEIGTECAAEGGEIGPGLRYLVSVDERLVLFVGAKDSAEIVRFSREETFGLRDAIRDGVRALRETGRSTKAPDPPPRPAPDPVPAMAGSGEYGDE